jgi:hypothetical protein
MNHPIIIFMVHSMGASLQVMSSPPQSYRNQFTRWIQGRPQLLGIVRGLVYLTVPIAKTCTTYTFKYGSIYKYMNNYDTSSPQGR